MARFDTLFPVALLVCLHDRNGHWYRAVDRLPAPWPGARFRTIGGPRPQHDAVLIADALEERRLDALHRARERCRRPVADVTTPPYYVTYSRDEQGVWLARSASVAGCHTHGHTLAEAKARIREALEVALDRNVAASEIIHVQE
jgi:predicted RNase H-like HicB family nuclease